MSATATATKKKKRNANSAHLCRTLRKDSPVRDRISRRNGKYAEIGMKTLLVTFKTSSAHISEQNP